MSIYLYSAAQVRELDRIAIEDRGIPGIVLMRRAALACVAVILEKYPHLPSSDDTVSVYCGSGNNAGDGYLIAGLLADKGIQVNLWKIGDVAKLSADASKAYEFACQRLEPKSYQHETIEDLLVVDALLGTGLSGEVRAEYAAVIQQINNSASDVLAVDIPSGLCADTGRVLGHAISADYTVSFIGLKQGLFTLHGRDQSGEIFFDRLEVPADVEQSPAVQKLELSELQQLLGPRPRHAHKHMFGHLLVVGGDQGMGGAVAMASVAAMRCGAGLVSLGTHPSHAQFLLNHQPEVMVHGIEPGAKLAQLLDAASVVVLGPGLGQSNWSKAVFEQVLNHTKAQSIAMVIDADGLRQLADDPQYRDNWVLTPHPGEAMGLLGATVQDNRFEAVSAIQQKYGGAILLKGNGTVISDGESQYLNPYGNPGMSSAGMGDVLSGVIGALLAQGLKPIDAANYGSVLHACAADACAKVEGERGLLATDLLPELRKLINAG